MNTNVIRITQVPEGNGYYTDENGQMYEILNVRVNHKRVFRRCSATNRLYIAVSDPYACKNVMIEPDYTIDLDVFGRIYNCAETSGAQRYGNRYFEYIVDVHLFTIIEYDENGNQIAIWYNVLYEEARSILGVYPTF